MIQILQLPRLNQKQNTTNIKMNIETITNRREITTKITNIIKTTETIEMIKNMTRKSSIKSTRIKVGIIDPEMTEIIKALSKRRSTNTTIGKKTIIMINNMMKEEITEIIEIITRRVDTIKNKIIKNTKKRNLIIMKRNPKKAQRNNPKKIATIFLV